MSAGAIDAESQEKAVPGRAPAADMMRPRCRANRHAIASPEWFVTKCTTGTEDTEKKKSEVRKLGNNGVWSSVTEDVTAVNET
jgi:hypothetical protein